MLQTTQGAVMNLGKIRSLQRLATDDGFFCICAIDHQTDFKELIRPNPDEVSYATAVSYKLELVRHFAPHVSAFLLDPVYGLGPSIAAGVLPGSVGLIANIEDEGYIESQAHRRTTLRSEWGTAKIKRIGADAVKLFFYHRADSGELAEQQRELVKQLVLECAEQNLALIAEPIWYPIAGEDPSSPEIAKKRAEAIIESAREMCELGIDMLKAEFPGNVSTDADVRNAEDACRTLDEIVDVPWVILSAGVPYDVFRRQTEIACAAGASGFLAGRAIWRDAVAAPSEDERRRAVESATERLDELARVARTYGRPWFAPPGVAEILDGMPEGWYRAFGS
jgi:tagatose 1,6-diphosphate aldolase